MQKQSLQRCKKDWDERLYSYGLQRFGKLVNLGWYRLFLNRLDLIHDSYLRYITKKENFERAENFEHYCKRFNMAVISEQRNTFNKKSLRGQEYINRNYGFEQEPDWERLEQKFVTNTQPKKDLVNYLDNIYFVKKYWEGYTFIEVGVEKGKSPTWTRDQFLKQAKSLQHNKEFKEILLQNV